MSPADLVADKPTMLIGGCIVRQIRQDNTTEVGHIVLELGGPDRVDYRIALRVIPGAVYHYHVGQKFTLALYEE